MRTRFAAAVIGIAGILGLWGCQKDGGSSMQTETLFTGDPQTIVAKVNGREIRLQEVDALAKRWTDQMGSTQDLGGRELQQRALDNIINRSLLAEEAEKEGLMPEDAYVEQYLDQMKGSMQSPAEFQAKLDQEGLTEAQLLKELRSDMGISSYMKRVIPDTIKVSAEDAHTFYEENPDQFQTGDQIHASHILVRTEENDSPEVKEKARRKAERLLDRVRSGADFAATARDSSDCPSAPRGGDLGFFGHGSMVPSFEAVAFALEPGQISDVVQTQFGYHVIRLEEKKASETIPYDPNLEQQLEGHLKQTRQKAVFDKKLEDLKAAASIDRKF